MLKLYKDTEAECKADKRSEKLFTVLVHLYFLAVKETYTFNGLNKNKM